MKLGSIAAGAVEEILESRPPQNSPNLGTLAHQLQGEPVYDPIIHFYHGCMEMRDAALGYCRDIAFVEGTLTST